MNWETLRPFGPSHHRTLSHERRATFHYFIECHTNSWGARHPNTSWIKHRSRRHSAEALRWPPKNQLPHVLDRRSNDYPCRRTSLRAAPEYSEAMLASRYDWG